MRKYYRVSAYVYTRDYELNDVCFFLTEDEAITERQRYEQIYPAHKGAYHMECDIKELSFDELKQEITVSELEELFGVTIDEPLGENI